MNTSLLFMYRRSFYLSYKTRSDGRMRSIRSYAEFERWKFFKRIAFRFRLIGDRKCRLGVSRLGVLRRGVPRLDERQSRLDDKKKSVRMRENPALVRENPALVMKSKTPALVRSRLDDRTSMEIPP